MIVPCLPSYQPAVLELINEAAQAYKDVIPPDRWKEPYMSAEDFQQQIAHAIRFWCYLENNRVVGVMGIQFKGPVTLIRHAYVSSAHQHRGIGTELLRHLSSLTHGPILIGTWAAATWAIRFYEKNGYRLLTPEEKNIVLQRYWDIPQRQIDTSVVLANQDWKGVHPAHLH